MSVSSMHWLQAQDQLERTVFPELVLPLIIRMQTFSIVCLMVEAVACIKLHGHKACVQDI